MAITEEEIDKGLAVIDKMLTKQGLKPMDDRSILFVWTACKANGLMIPMKEAERCWLKITKDMGLQKLPVGVFSLLGITNMVKSVRALK